MKKKYISFFVALILMLAALALNAAFNFLIFFRMPLIVSILFACIDFLNIVLILKLISKRRSCYMQTASQIIIILALSPVSFLLYFLASDNLLTSARKKMLKDITGRDGKASALSYADLSERLENCVTQLEHGGIDFSVDNCDIRYFNTAEGLFDAQIQAISKAECYICMEYYAIASGKIANRFIDALCKKAEQGIKIYVIIDRIGTKGKLKAKDKKRLKKSGVNLTVFGKVHVPFSFNVRDHRKLTVIDGNLAFTGGANIADKYVNLDPSSMKWKDFGICIEGGSAAVLAKMFFKTWKYLTREDVSFDSKKSEVQGDKVISFSTSYFSGSNDFSMINLSLISSAAKSIRIITPYLILNDQISDALISAARRGVDIKIIVPGVPDKAVPYVVTLANLDLLIREGIEGYIYSPGFIHTKTTIIDDEILFCGTANQNQRSTYFDFEYQFVAEGRVCEDAVSDFCKTLSKCRVRQNSSTGDFEHFIIGAARLFQPLF